MNNFLLTALGHRLAQGPQHLQVKAKSLVGKPPCLTPGASWSPGEGTSVFCCHLQRLWVEGRAEVKRVTILAGGHPGWCPPACAGLYKPDRWGRRRKWRKTTGGKGPQMGGSGGWLFCGCLAGDLSEEWIQKRLLFVEARFRDILSVKCQAPTVARKQEVPLRRRQTG